MIVRLNYEFEFDETDYDSKYVDIEGLAKNSALRDLKDLLENNQISEDDFYITN